MSANAAADHPTLIFLHLPKTAGTTLVEVIKRQYQARESYVVTAGEVIESLHRLAEWPEARRAQLRAVFCHMPYGVHKLLPRPCAYTTVLREPVDRVVSNYYYVLRTQRHKQSAFVNGHGLSLRDYVEGREIDGQRVVAPRNNLTMRLCNEDPLTGNVWTDRLPRSAEALAAAKRNLDSFAVVGLTVAFDASVGMMAKCFGWSGVTIESRNVSRQRPKVDDLDGETVALIREYNAMDIDLYAHGEALFHQHLARWGTAPIVHAEQQPMLSRWRRRIGLGA